MLRRIGFRMLLPLLNLILYLALICIGSAGNIQAIAANADFSTRAKVAFSLNVPALAAAIVVNVVVFHFPASFISWLALPFIPLFWFGVGLWIDRRLGWSRRRIPKRSFIRDTFLIVTCLATALFAVELVKTILQQRRGSADMPWLDFGVCAWTGFLLTVLAGMFGARFFKKGHSGSIQATSVVD